MLKTTLEIDGMMCGMCEAHMNDAIRKAFAVKKVTSDHAKKHTVIVSETALDEDNLKDTVTSAGYTLLSVRSEPYKKWSLFQK